MEFLHQWLVFSAIMVAVTISPGPSFLMCVRNSVLHGTKAGLLTSIGLGVGLIVHVTYTIYGIAALVHQSIFLFNLIKWGGAAYLFYIGYQALKSKGYKLENPINDVEPKTAFSCFWNGALTALLNPKAVLFFTAIFAQFITADMVVLHKIILGATAVLSDTIWFSIVAVFLTRPMIRARFLRASQWIDRVCGGLFIALGIRLALTKAAS